MFKDFGDIIVPDGDTVGRTYQIKAFVRTNTMGTTEDNQTILLSASPSQDFLVTETSSNLLPSISSFQQSTATIIVVEATEIQGKSNYNFSTLTVNTVFLGTPSVYATDVNGRIDKNYAASIQLELRKSINCSTVVAGELANPTDGLNLPAVAGVATFSNLQFTAPGTALRIYATSSPLIPLCALPIDATL
ncbi:MAG TPA: hypothetical protein PLY93_03470 [Turneriella sp.]|nr:hypothetical protein [Turneriella sp.]